MPRRARLLGEGDPPHRLDLQEPERPVRAGAREHDADGLSLLGLGERAQKVIDRQVGTSRVPARGDLQRALGERHAGVGRDDVDVIGRDRKSLAPLDDRHAGGAGEDIRQPALMAGIEVLHQHEGHPGAGRQMGEELGEGLQAPGGRADPDDGKGAFRPWPVYGRGLGLIRRGVVQRFPGGVR